jgi:hypothetical protein
VAAWGSHSAGMRQPCSDSEAVIVWLKTET